MNIRLLTLLLATIAGTLPSGALAKSEPHPGARTFLAELAAEKYDRRTLEPDDQVLLSRSTGAVFLGAYSGAGTNAG